MKTRFVNLYNMLKALPREPADETPLRDLIPGSWPTWKDLKDLIEAAEGLEREP